MSEAIIGLKNNNIKQIACGYYHTFILKNDGTVWCCGDNQYGQLGLGTSDTNTHSKFVQVNINNVKQIACGAYFTFILKNDGSIWSCGQNSAGQLGLGNSTTYKTFTKVTTNINNDVAQITCGLYHTFILKNDGTVYSCGYNTYGGLGLGNTTTYNTFTKVTTNISNVKQIACGYHHTVMLKNDGTVWSCGQNTYGQLGLGNSTTYNTFTKMTTNISNDVAQIACGECCTFVLKNNGSIWSCGQNTYGQLGLGNTTNKNTFTQVTTNISNDVKQVICGHYHTFILKNNGSIWSCGYNMYSQLGLNDDTNRTSFTQATTNISNDVKQVACGGEHTFILKNNDNLYSCGYSNKGQLGLGNTTTYKTPTNIPRL